MMMSPVHMIGKKMFDPPSPPLKFFFSHGLVDCKLQIQVQRRQSDAYGIPIITELDTKRRCDDMVINNPYKN